MTGVLWVTTVARLRLCQLQRQTKTQHRETRDEIVNSGISDRASIAGREEGVSAASGASSWSRHGRYAARRRCAELPHAILHARGQAREEDTRLASVGGDEDHGGGLPRGVRGVGLFASLRHRRRVEKRRGCEEVDQAQGGGVSKRGAGHTPQRGYLSRRAPARSRRARVPGRGRGRRRHRRRAGVHAREEQPDTERRPGHVQVRLHRGCGIPGHGGLFLRGPGQRRPGDARVPSVHHAARQGRRRR